jgi:hypothetical protein
MNWRFVPGSDIGRASFDHLVGGVSNDYSITSAARAST